MMHSEKAARQWLPLVYLEGEIDARIYQSPHRIFLISSFVHAILPIRNVSSCRIVVQVVFKLCSITKENTNSCAPGAPGPR